MGDSEAPKDAARAGDGGAAAEASAIGVDGHTHERSCLNCGTGLAGAFCHHCGQQAHVHRTLGAFWHDLLHGVLHFEGKIWRTLPLLVWRPGELTRRYIDGQRARFVSPIALFLFSVFLMFAVMGLTGALDGTTQAARDDVTEEIASVSKRIGELRADRAEAVRQKQPTTEVDAELVEAERELATLRAIVPGVIKVDTPEEAEAMPSWLGGWVGKAGKNPELLFYKLKTNAYKFSWALIPISVPFIWLLFPFSRRFGWYDHTVFVTYSLCFMTMLLVAASTIGLVLPVIAAFAWFVPPIHMYRQLKGTYGVSRFGAIWRTVALTLFAWMAIGLFTSIIVGVGEIA